MSLCGTDKRQTNDEQVKIGLLSRWKLEAEFRNFYFLRKYHDKIHTIGQFHECHDAFKTGWNKRALDKGSNSPSGSPDQPSEVRTKQPSFSCVFQGILDLKIWLKTIVHIFKL